MLLKTKGKKKLGGTETQDVIENTRVTRQTQDVNKNK